MNNTVYSIKKVNRRKPVIKGRASIITTSITIKILWKRQLEHLIAYLIMDNYEFSWKPILGTSGMPDYYLLVIDEIIWAENLTHISKILEKCDYQEP